MFQKDGSSAGGKKDAPLRKSDRRRLRDRAAEVLFVGGGSGGKNDGDGGAAQDEGQAEWISRAERLVDDAIVAPKGGEVLSRRMKLSGGEHATLFLRTPSTSEDSSPPSIAEGEGASYDDILKSYPTAWPYRRTAQPILLEYEDADRKTHLVPLLPLLAALPPPPPSPPLGKAAEPDDDCGQDDNARRYRIPNVVVHPEVSKFMCRGADLMKSGIRSFPSPWALRQSKGLVTVSVIGNPQPLAVGTVDGSLFREYCYPKNGNRGRGDWREEASGLVGPGKKGVGIAIVNCYGDDLWKGALPPKSVASSSKTKGDGVLNPLGGGVYDDGNYGNAGFVDGKVVCPIIDMGGDDESSSGDEGGDQDGNTKAAAAATEEMEKLAVSDQNDGGSAADDEAENAKAAGNETKNGDEAEAGPDHNDILLSAFYTSLLLLLSSKVKLPMPVSTYYAKHLLAAVPPAGPRLDMKQTTHKKIGPFLKEMESEGVIKLGPSKDGKDRCAFLVDIAKNNPELVRFKRKWKEEGGGTSLAGASDAQKTKLAVVDLFIVPRHVSDGLQLDRDAVMAANAKTDERRGTGFLTKPECRALIEGYVEREDLVDPKGKGRVLVNGPLCDALYRTSKKSKQPGQKDEYPTSVKRKDLIERWLGRMDRGHALVQMPGSKILNLGRGEPKPVDIEVEFRQGNRKKFLMRLRGMEEYGVDGVTLSQDVSHRLACSSSVETDPVGRPALKKGRVELVFQGHLSEELTALLTGDERLTGHGGVKGSEYGLPRSVVNVTLRKGVPARKKR